VEDESPTPSQAGEEGVLTVTTLAELNEAIDLGEDLIACDMTLKPTRQVFPCTAEDAPKHPYVYVLFNPNDQGIPPEVSSSLTYSLISLFTMTVTNSPLCIFSPLYSFIGVIFCLMMQTRKPTKSSFTIMTRLIMI